MSGRVTTVLVSKAANRRNGNLQSSKVIMRYEKNWKEKGIWLLIIVVFQSIAFPFLLGRSGFLIAALATGFLAVFLVQFILQFQLPFRRLFGLFLLTMTFMNVDAIASAPEFASVNRLSWFLSAGFAFYLFSIRHEIINRLTRNPTLILFTVFTLMMIVWSLFAGRFPTIFQRQLFYLFVVLMTAEFVLHDRRMTFSLLYALVLASVSATAMLIMEYNFAEYIGLSTTIERGGMRTAALYINPNRAAFAISFSAIALGLLTKMGFPRRWAIVLFLFIAVGMISTFSRKGAPWLIFAVISLATAFFTQHQQTAFRSLMGIGLATVITFIMGYGLVNSSWVSQLDIRRGEMNRLQQMGSMMTGDTETYIAVFDSSGRARLSAASWAAIQRDPILGYGAMSPDISRDSPEFQPHNLPLYIWVEYGIFNLLLFTIILLIAFFKMLQADFYTRIYGLLFMGHLMVMALGAHTLLDNRVAAIPLGLVLIFSQLQLVDTTDSMAVEV
jgi:hypothetical protein